ncbi:hypothetical protein L0Y34_01840 [Candidatus Parcubacteria bacterium]|nr:hypothetical protein [Candidatus Parcubacteria bacterium]
MMSRVIPVVLILVAIGLFFSYINPTYAGAIAALRSEIRSYDAALHAAERYAEKESQLIAERNQIPTEGLERVETFLPDGVDNVQLILDLNALADRSGLLLSDFDIAETSGEPEGDAFALVGEGPTDTLELSVTAIGDYESFKTFLEGAELSLRPLDMVDLTIADSETGVYSYTMTFRIYWLR